jgi:hypothetical protein
VNSKQLTNEERKKEQGAKMPLDAFSHFWQYIHHERTSCPFKPKNANSTLKNAAGVFKQ